MKTYRIIYILISLLFLELTVSCERLLEVEIPQNQITAEGVFEDLQGANAALAGLYAGLYDNSPVAGDQTGKLLGTYTDDLDYYGNTTSTGILDLYQNVQIDSNPAVYSYWSNAYQKIYMANAIIKGISNSSIIEESEKNRIKGEALIVRSILFFYLQQIFGDIPYPTTTDYWQNQHLTKTSSEEVLRLLINDLNESAILLKDEYRHSERIFPNRKVAQLMLAKIYMLQEKWHDGEVILKTIVQSPLYQFQNDISKVFNKSSTHILWQLKPKNSGDATKEIGAYYFTNGAPNNFALSQDLVNIFSASDLRKQNYMAAVTFNGTTWYRANKYKNLSNNITEYSQVFRLEEVYLLLAEALTQQDKIEEALPLLNKTRQRANLSSLTADIPKETFLHEVLMEERKEFFTEMGLRFLTLKRINRLDLLLTTKPNWKSSHRVWPLPQKELLLNPHLNPQNTGY